MAAQRAAPPLRFCLLQVDFRFEGSCCPVMVVLQELSVSNVVLSSFAVSDVQNAPTVRDSKGAAPWTPQKRARATLL